MTIPLSVALLALAAPPGVAAAPGPTLEEIAAPAGGAVGFAALDLATGRSLALRDHDRFPTQSVFKLPVAIQVLRRVDEGKLDLSRAVTLEAADARRGPPGTIAVPAVKTVRELLEAMIVSSDNVACDKLLSLVDGPGSVTARMRSLGVSGVEIRYSERELAAGSVDNTATPAAMVGLLEVIARREAGLSPASHALLEKLLLAATTGPQRLKGALPPGTPVAHKTGTSETRSGKTDATNDVGLITLPNGHRIAVAVFVHASPADLATREGTIARLARAAYDVFSKPVAPGAAPVGARRYRLVRRDMELIIFSRTEGSLEIQDHLATREEGAGVIKLDYVLQPAAPLFRVIVRGAGTGGFGSASAAKPEDVARALEFFGGSGTLNDVWRSPGPYMLGERSETSSYPSGIAVVARHAGADVAVEVRGRWPVVNLIHSVGVTGRAVTETSPQGRPRKIRSFTRFMIPRLDPADGAVSHLRVTVAPRAVTKAGKRAISDSRRYWHTEITQLGAGQAVDLFSTDEDDRLSATISNSHLLVAENGSSAQKRVQATQLAFVLPPPPAEESIRLVSAVVDVPPDRAEMVRRALRALDEPSESVVHAIVVGAAPGEVLSSVPLSLALPAARADPEALLKRALAARENRQPVIVFTDRPAEIARASAALTFRHPLHVVHVAGPAPRGWSRLLGKQSPDAKIVERTGGIWVQLADSGAALDSLWEHLIWPRFLDDVELTSNGAPFRPDGYLAAAFETPGQPSRATPPATLALGSDMRGMFVSAGPSPGAPQPERWEVSGLVWNKRLRFRAEMPTIGYVAIRNLRVSPALAALPAPYRSAVEAYLSQLNDVLPNRPQAYVAP